MSFIFKSGTIPLLVSLPHNGSAIPDSIAETMTPAGKSSRDTDWFLDRLYDFEELSNASMLTATQSRYVVDLNRAKSDESLYPGQTTTGLIPEERFDGKPIYTSGPPETGDVACRIETVWQPYHDKIKSEMASMVEQFGVAVMVEAHSIASVLPRLFPGTIPDFNLGTNRGASCDPALQAAIENVLESQSDYSHVVNARFVGGYNTRHYGRPSNHWHTVQIELSQATYLNEATLQWDDGKAKSVQPVLRNIIGAITQWLPST
jgi:N-formylglutamate deformylase